MKKTLIIIIPGLLAITALMTFLLVFTRRSVRQIEQQGASTTTYDGHYVLISDDRSDQWRSIYAAADKAAEESGVSLEWLGDDLPAQYTVSDCLRIAAAARADGIILYPGEEKDETKLIGSAAQQGIPVITVLEDDADSERVSFIGLNSYQMGEMYGNRILENLTEGENRILVLQNTSSDNPAAALMYSQMVQTVEQGRGENEEVLFAAHEISTVTSFDAEEDIRDIFLMGEDLPNILICLDLISTECVCQALVDYNKVGDVTVIGYYASDKVIDGLKKGLIDSTLYLDAGEIGTRCIEALNEYRELGHVSSYFNVGMKMITPQTVGEIAM